MTYIDYLNAFNQWIEEDNPTDKSVILYYAMLSMFNRRGWPRWAGVDTQRLMAMVRTTSNKTALRARDALVAAGFIEYKSGRKGKSTEYRLLQRTLRNDTVNDTVSDTVSDTVNDTVNDTVSDTVNDTPNKTKTKINLLPPDGGSKAHVQRAHPTPAERPADWGFGPELTAALEDWLRYKQEKRQAYKPMGLKSLIAQVKNNAAKFGETAVADLIRQCMAANWQGIIWDKLGQSAPGRSVPKGMTPGANVQPSTERIQRSSDWLDSFLGEQEEMGHGQN